jgi:hypothetical protein
MFAAEVRTFGTAFFASFTFSAAGLVIRQTSRRLEQMRELRPAGAAWETHRTRD